MHVTRKSLQRILWGGNVLLTCAACGVGVALLVSVNADPRPPRVQAPRQFDMEPARADEVSSVNDYKAIWQNMEPKKPIAVPASVQAPATQASAPKRQPLAKRIHVAGVLMGHRQGDIANIPPWPRDGAHRAPASGKPPNYWRRKGDTVQDALVKEIRHDSVVFEYFGEDVTLYIHDGNNKVRHFPLSGLSGTRPPAQNDFREYEVSTKIHENEWVISRMEVDALKTNPLQSIEEYKIKVAQHIPAGGEMDGVQIESFKPGSLPEQRGFQPGDLVKKVNGIPLTSQPNMLEAYAAAQKADTVVVELERAGRPVVLTFHVQK